MALFRDIVIARPDPRNTKSPHEEGISQSAPGMIRECNLLIRTRNKFVPEDVTRVILCMELCHASQETAHRYRRSVTLDVTPTASPAAEKLHEFGIDEKAISAGPKFRQESDVQQFLQPLRRGGTRDLAPIDHHPDSTVGLFKQE